MLNDFSAILEITFTVVFIGCTGILDWFTLFKKARKEHFKFQFYFFRSNIPSTVNDSNRIGSCKLSVFIWIISYNIFRWFFTFMLLILFSQTNNQINSVMLFQSVLCGFWAIILVFTTCECGQRFSDAFKSFNGVLSQIDWYLLPISAQRILPMIIINAQQPMDVRCYGNVPCGRATFKKVMRAQNIYASKRIRPNNNIIFLGGQHCI